MAKDDYFRIVYQVLDFLYSQLRKGIRKVPVEVLIREGNIPNIPKEYFWQIIDDLIEERYVKSFRSETQYIHSDIPPITKLSITMKGIEYLVDNSMMKKAAEALKTAADLIP